jgi:hypothetical protein
MRKMNTTMSDKKMVQPCVEWAEKLALTRMEDLPSEEVDKLLKHLADCPACSAIQLEYRMMDMLIRNYPPERVVQYQPKRLPKPGLEFYRLRLLLQRQMKRRHGITLMVAALLIFLLFLGVLLGLLAQHQTGLTIPLIALAGLFTPLYPLWEGLHAFFTSLLPVTFEEVRQHRRNRYREYGSEINQKERFQKKRWQHFGMRNVWIMFGVIVLIFAISKLSTLKWAYFLAFGVDLFLVQFLLILDTLIFDEEKDGALSRQEQKMLPLVLQAEEFMENALLGDEK